MLPYGAKEHERGEKEGEKAVKGKKVQREAFDDD